MANPFTKAWKYMMALFSSKVDEYADPKVQIQQAIEDAQRQHQALSQQAAAVIGNQRQLEMKLTRQMGDVERFQSSARQALVLADEARAKGDAAKAAQYEQTAQAFATQLVAGEQQMEDLKTMHDQALQSAEQAKMQEQVSASLQSMSSLAAPGNTPSLDEVRDKIERRYANALGSAELSQNSVEGRMIEVQKSTLDMAGARDSTSCGPSCTRSCRASRPGPSTRQRPLRRLRRRLTSPSRPDGRQGRGGPAAQELRPEGRRRPECGGGHDARSRGRQPGGHRRRRVPAGAS